MTTVTDTLTFTGAPYSSPPYGSGHQLISIDVSAADPASGKFNLGWFSFQGVNNPGATRPDTVMVFGYNVTAEGAREVPTEPTLAFHFENLYYQFGLLGMEWHLQSIDTNGVQHRPISFWLPRDGGQGSYGLLSADAFNLLKYDGTQKLKFDLANNAVNYYGPVSTFFNTNNYIVSWQMNVTKDHYVPLPYIDNSNWCHVTPPLFVETQLILNPLTTAAAKAIAGSNQVALITDGNRGAPCMAFSQNGVFYMAHAPSTPISAR